MEIQDIPEAEGAVALGQGCAGITFVRALTQEWFTNRQPLVVGLEGGITAGDPLAFGFRLVILGTTTPAVIRCFVVVPNRDQGR